VGLYDFVTEESVEWNLLMASVMVAAIPVVILLPSYSATSPKGSSGGHERVTYMLLSVPWRE
jgi:ABC-type glycerol-3-phosphate transport system permease component